MAIAVESVPIGAVLAADFGLFKHRGIVTGRDAYGRLLVTSNSRRRGGVVQEYLDEFRQGKPVILEAQISLEGMPHVLQRAMTGIGRRYDLLAFNCDHFVEWVLGKEPKSEQLRAWGAMASLTAILIIATEK